MHKEVLQQYFKTFAHNEFMINQVEGLPPYLERDAYQEEQQKFMKAVREVSVHTIPKDSSTITSHVTCKVKQNDGGSLKMKARVAPQGNKHEEKDNLKTDSSQCFPNWNTHPSFNIYY